MITIEENEERERMMDLKAAQESAQEEGHPCLMAHSLFGGHDDTSWAWYLLPIAVGIITAILCILFF